MRKLQYKGVEKRKKMYVAVDENRDCMHIAASCTTQANQGQVRVSGAVVVVSLCCLQTVTGRAVATGQMAERLIILGEL